MSKNKRIATPTDEEVAAYGQADGDKASPAQDPSNPGGDPDEAPGPQTAPAEPAQRSELDDWKDKFLRAKAEFSNYQRRQEKERADFHQYAIADLAKALIPLLDDLDRVIETGSAPGATAESLVNGVKLLRQNLTKMLSQFHIQPIEAQGQPFDPKVHEAMLEQHAPEQPPRTVLQELSRGYRLHDRLLRPARVIVSKGEAAPEAESDEKGEGA
jgi:molecular chaperone GrpE